MLYNSPGVSAALLFAALEEAWAAGCLRPENGCCWCTKMQVEDHAASTLTFTDQLFHGLSGSPPINSHAELPSAVGGGCKRLKLNVSGSTRDWDYYYRSCHQLISNPSRYCKGMLCTEALTL